MSYRRHESAAPGYALKLWLTLKVQSQSLRSAVLVDRKLHIIGFFQVSVQTDLIPHCSSCFANGHVVQGATKKRNRKLTFKRSTVRKKLHNGKQREQATNFYFLSNEADGDCAVKCDHHCSFKTQVKTSFSCRKTNACSGRIREKG